MTELKMTPLSLSLMKGPRSDRLRFEMGLGRMFDEYGFALLTDAHPKLVEQTIELKQHALPYFLSPRWEEEVVANWPLRKHGQLGPTSEYEEKHLDAKTGNSRDKGELKRYVSVNAEGEGWEAQDNVRKLLPKIFGRRYSIGLQVARSYENARLLKPGTLSNMLSMGLNTHTTARIQWYPSNGYSIDHTDKCAITVLDFEPGLQIESPQGSGNYLELVGAQPGDLVINLGDTFSRMLNKDKTLSTRHRVQVPSTCAASGRIVFPLFIHTNLSALFPDGENVWQWCVDEWSRESHVSERAV